MTLRTPPWSFSSLNAFETCPRQYFHIKVAKDVEETKHESTLWGTRFHHVAEMYLKGMDLLPPEFEQYREYLHQFQGNRGDLYIELELGINRRLEPCDFHDPEVWCRGIVDVLQCDMDWAYVDDHKTGKRKPDSKQLKLFSLLVFAHFPKIQNCETTFQWIKTNEVDTETFRRDQVPEMWDAFVPGLQRFAQAFREETFPPRPSGLCKAHCPVKMCQFCGKGR